MSPRVTIVTPTKDRPQELARAYASMRAQTYAGWAWIVIDDGSDEPYAKRLLAEEPRARVLECSESRGKAHTRNLGLAEVQTPWVGFLDDDDELLPDALSQLLASVDAASAGGGPLAIHRGGLRLILPEGRIRVVRSDYRGEDVWTQYLFTVTNIFPWIAPTVAARELTFRDRPCFQDADYFLRLAAKLPVVRLSSVLGRYHLHGVSGSANTQRAPDHTLVLHQELAALRMLFETEDPSIQDRVMRGIYALAQAARYVYHATAFPQVSIAATWLKALRLSPGKLTLRLLLRLTAVRIERKLPWLRRLRIRIGG